MNEDSFLTAAATLQMGGGVGVGGYSHTLRHALHIERTSLFFLLAPPTTVKRGSLVSVRNVKLLSVISVEGAPFSRPRKHTHRH